MEWILRWGKARLGKHSREKEEAGEVDIGVNSGIEADLTDSRVNRGSVAGLVYVRHWPLPGVDLGVYAPQPPRITQQQPIWRGREH